MSYSVGETVKGVVSGVANYGAFVKLEDGSVGMIHISKLSKNFVADIHEFIKKDDSVTATVVSVADGKIGLSLVGEEYNKPKKSSMDFESMLSSFKIISDEKLSRVNSRINKKLR